MLRRMVPVLRWGSKSPRGDQKSLCLCSQAFAIVRKRSQSSAIIRNRSQEFASVAHPRQSKWSRNAEMSPLIRLHVSKVSTVTGIGGVVVAKRRTVVTFGLASRRPVPTMTTVTGNGGGRGRETQNCRHFWTCLLLSCPKTDNCHRHRRGRGREPQNSRHSWTCSFLVVSQQCFTSDKDRGRSWSRTAELSSLFGLASCRRVPKVSTVTGIGGRGREPRNCQLSSFFGLALCRRVPSVNCHRDRGRSWSQNVDLSSLFGLASCRRVPKVSTVTGIGIVHFWRCSCRRVPKVTTVTGIGGSWSRNTELSSFSDPWLSCACCGLYNKQ